MKEDSKDKSIFLFMIFIIFILRPCNTEIPYSVVDPAIY